LLIVVDDLHLIYDAEWVVPFFRRLLPLLPADAHMLITGRSLPPAPLWRMRSKQMLCVIEEQTLSFTQREAMKLFESYGLTRSQSDIAWRQTHGRALILDAKARSLAEAQEEIINEQRFTLGQRAIKRRIRHVNGYVI
jgi:ATP/maltotriose-dependent transcriptional regulator MalT